MKGKRDDGFIVPIVSEQITQLFERFDRQHIKVRIVYNDKHPDDIAGFLIEGDGWEERVTSLAALYGWLNGFTRAKSIII